MLDRLITGARVFDGSRFLEQANVGIAGDQIAYVGAAKPPASTISDGHGRILAPAFIDTHTHADHHCLDPTNDGASALSQGVGTLVVGNCGFSATPEALPHPVLLPPRGARNAPLTTHRRRLAGGLPVDVADLLGHGTLRTAVMGEARAASTAEIERMAAILIEFLEGGGLGLSVGLNYPEAHGYTADELTALGRVLSRFDRPLTCHIRDQGAGIREAMEEVAGVGERAGCRVLISHFRPISDRYDALLDPLLERIEDSDGLAIDLYPYAAGFTTLAWFFEYLFGRLPDGPATFPADEVEERAFDVCIGGLADVHILRHLRPDAAASTIAAIASAEGEPPGRVAQPLYAEDPTCLCIYDRESRPAIIDRIVTHPKCMIGSDGYLFPTGYRDACHPRSFGAFVGFLARFARPGAVPLDAALARLTAQPAAWFRLRDRGRIGEGARANLVLFALEALDERATYAQPTLRALGMHEVIVGGQTVWQGTRTLGERSGRRAVPASNGLDAG
jgi:N-acyl-D-amino-acid deacylase